MKNEEQNLNEAQTGNSIKADVSGSFAVTEREVINDIKYIKLMDCSISQPTPHSSTVAFVPLIGFTQAIFSYGKWKSTITHQVIEPTHWLKPIDFYDELAEKCGLTENGTPMNNYIDEHGQNYTLTKFGYKRREQNFR